ncbi:DUF5684 domain-containing protein [Streptantibioticus rubrisoli]|uniref:DUF5684 domain-containing protein n=1 Tax=Streptantibioticus rubrisoli TaxID=1387313 RepID=A0ABT1PMX7_9ACTN|nr:DUF5684 domain-containing protein [Streptantibioticus rubrisoli]MCQ4045630.1 DUF5684 domain-containing protein [Streptantibioticus rubrisoli]
MTESGFAPVHVGVLVVALVVAVLEIAATWRVLVKASRPGWGVIIPIYNVYLWLKVAGRPGWWLVLYLIPGVNVIVHLVVSIDVARSFDKGTMFGVGLWLLPWIGIPILGFGSARYVDANPSA